ncbi:MAG: alpha/beta hydrolase [Pseudomonadota bacterium]
MVTIGSTTTSATRTGYVDVAGLQIYFAVYGQGTPLVLVHGWGADADTNWRQTGWLDVLSPHRQIITIDVRGHGRSDKPHKPEFYSYAAMSKDVLAVMDALEISTADYIGYSMGAFMGAYLLGHHCERFNTMVLGGIGDETRESAAQGAVIAQALWAVDPATIDNPYARAVRDFVGANPTNDLRALGFAAQQMWPEGFPIELAGSGLKRANLPLLIVNGADDYPYVNSADLFAAAAPNGQHLRIPDTDHLSVVPDPRFHAAVLEFLDS